MRRYHAIVVLLLVAGPSVATTSAAAGTSLPCPGTLVVNTGTCGIAPHLDPLPDVTYAPGAVVPVSGRGVRAGEQVGIAGQWSPIQTTADGGLGFALPATVRAGVSDAVLGDGSPPAPLAGSAPQPSVIRPAITSAIATSGGVAIVMAPAAEAGQPVALSLVGTDVSSGPG